MNKFDSEWIKFMHCLLWKLGKVNIWTFHRVMYELSREKVIDIDGWTWFGERPRSSLVDAIIAIFVMSGVVVERDDELIVKREPPAGCSFGESFDRKVEEAVGRVLGEVRAGAPTS